MRKYNKEKQFGSSSEQTVEQLDGQLSLLFNEAESYAAPPGAQKSTQVTAHTRKRSGSVKDVVPDNIPVEVVEHRLIEKERVCPQCGEVMWEIGTEVRETLKFIPAKAVLRRDVYYIYACENCQKNDIATPIVKVPKEPAVMFRLFGSTAVSPADPWCSEDEISVTIVFTFVPVIPRRTPQFWTRNSLPPRN